MMLTHQSTLTTVLLALLGSSLALPQLRNPDKPVEKKLNFEPMLVEYKGNKKTYFPLQADRPVDGYVTCSSSMPWWLTGSVFAGAHCYCRFITTEKHRIDCADSPKPVNGIVDGKPTRVCHLEVYRDAQNKVNRCVVKNMSK
jgi:hypothetical protein